MQSLSLKDCIVLFCMSVYIHTAISLLHCCSCFTAGFHSMSRAKYVALPNSETPSMQHCTQKLALHLRASCAAGSWPDSPYRLHRFLGTCHGVQPWLGCSRVTLSLSALCVLTCSIVLPVSYLSVTFMMGSTQWAASHVLATCASHMYQSCSKSYSHTGMHCRRSVAARHEGTGWRAG